MRKLALFFIFFISCITVFAQRENIIPTTAFVVTGAVKNELKFTIADLLKWKQDSLGDVIIRNHRGEPKTTAKQMRGVLLKTILDSAGVTAGSPKECSEYVVTLAASDGYRNVYSWNELFNTDIGNHVYIVTEMDGKQIGDMPDRILVLSLSDFNSGRRHLKALARVEVKKMPQ